MTPPTLQDIYAARARVRSHVPASPLITVTGFASAVLAPFGSHGINLAAITAAICTEPQADADPARRYTAAVVCGVGYLVAGVLAASIAALFAAFGVLMLELAAYFALVQFRTAIAAAVLLGVVNFLLGGLILLVANRKARDRGEFETAVALHNSAIEALQSQARSFDTSRPVASGLEAILPSLIVPAVGLVMKSLRQRKADTGS